GTSGSHSRRGPIGSRRSPNPVDARRRRRGRPATPAPHAVRSGARMALTRFALNGCVPGASWTLEERAVRVHVGDLLAQIADSVGVGDGGHLHVLSTPIVRPSGR